MKKYSKSPVSFFTVAIIFVLLLSSVLSIIGFSSTIYTLNPQNTETTSTLITVNNLLSPSGLKELIPAVFNISNSSNILLMFLVLLGVFSTIKSGFLAVLFSILNKKVSRRNMIFIIILLSSLFALTSELAFLVIMPLSAYYFYTTNRNPYVGIFVSFAAISISSGVNLIVTSTDLLLNSYTQNSASQVVNGYIINHGYSLFFTIVFLIVSSIVVTIFTERVTCADFPNPKIDEDEEDNEIVLTSNTITGLLMAAILNLILIIVFTLGVLPKTAITGFFLDANESSYILQLFGANSIFQTSIMVFTAITFMLTSFVYLIGSKSYEENKNFLYDAFDEIGRLIVLFIFSTILIKVFIQSNIGDVLIGNILYLFTTLQLSSYILIILFILIMLFMNILIPNVQNKWALLAPIIVPLFMRANITPEFTLLIFKASSSITNPITPLFPMFILYIYLLDKYKTDNKEIRIRDSIKYMIPYCIIYGIIIITMIVAWYMISLPIGINSFTSL